jgi:hypothetical protein
MRIQSAFSISLLAIALPLIATAQTKDFSGTWQSDSNASQKWVLDQKDGRIHVQEMNGGRVEADFTCALNGQECAAKENGRSEKIMMYFNGDKLVEIRERNAVSSKQRLTVSDDGKTLTVETVPLSSDQKAETLSFRRQST